MFGLLLETATPFRGVGMLLSYLLAESKGQSVHLYHFPTSLHFTSLHFLPPFVPSFLTLNTYTYLVPTHISKSLHHRSPPPTPPISTSSSTSQAPNLLPPILPLLLPPRRRMSNPTVIPKHS